MEFKRLDEIPKNYQELIEQLVARGIIISRAGEFEYPLSMDMLYLIKLMQRMN